MMLTTCFVIIPLQTLATNPINSFFWIYLLIAGIGFFLFRRAPWYYERGKFPPFFKANQTNLIKAYSALGALMISIDRETAKSKVDYMLRYFERNFSPRNDDQRKNIIYSMRNQVSPVSVANWINKNVKNEKYKTGLIHFLVDVGMIDGSLTKKERSFITMISNYLKLSPSLVDKLISDIDAANQKRQSNEQKRVVRRPVNYAYQILGIAPNATDKEIKKAYRTLVKKHHPDNFANGSVSQQEDAEERFIEIQKAYESLT